LDVRLLYLTKGDSVLLLMALFNRVVSNELGGHEKGEQQNFSMEL
jgi:hypothetical protein